VKLLLDTHIWLWSLAEPTRLGRRLRHQLRDRSNELWLSPVSTWEALLLNAKGRIRLHGDLSEWLGRATAHMREAPLTHEIVLAAHHLPLPQPDPADRFLSCHRPDPRFDPGHGRRSTAGAGRDSDPGQPLTSLPPLPVHSGCPEQTHTGISNRWTKPEWLPPMMIDLAGTQSVRRCRVRARVLRKPGDPSRPSAPASTARTRTRPRRVVLQATEKIHAFHLEDPTLSGCSAVCV